jgi:O-methyltransferase
MTVSARSLRGLLRRAQERLEPRLNPSARADLEPEFLRHYESCRPYTMTSLARMYGLYTAVRYAVEEQVPGDIVECGVWRGGSSMLAALTLLSYGEQTRSLFLYDTFAGMVEPTAVDGEMARRGWIASLARDDSGWCFSPLDEVRRNMLTTGLSADRVKFVQGKVEDTIPATSPAQISVLRLDTDWYESTKHELEHLYPLLAPGGVLILDDYGFWEGARRAVDEYFGEHPPRPLLTRLDSCARVGVKRL